MPLPTAHARERIHDRQISVQGYARTDGLYDIEAHLTDRKDQEFVVAGRRRPAGASVHEMWLRLTIDTKLVIVDAVAASDVVPYEGTCGNITAAYHKLIGLRIEAGFRMRVMQALGGLNGCTHLTELVMAIATGAVQTLAGRLNEAAKEEPARKPLPVDGCHALDSRGEAVRLFFPQWFKGVNE